jgi:hypothetical protein
MGRAGRYRRSPVSPGRLGRLGLQPGQDHSTAWFQLAAELPARLWSACPASTSRSRALAARLCQGRASYAADVGRCLEH